MEEYDVWLQSDCTKILLRAINELVEEIRQVVTNGVLLQEKNSNKIALDYTLALGQIEGLRMAIDTIKDIKNSNEEERNGN